MEQWSPEDANNPESNIPKLIYTIPSCGNPTGVSASLERKKEIYVVYAYLCFRTGVGKLRLAGRILPTKAFYPAHLCLLKPLQ